MKQRHQWFLVQHSTLKRKHWLFLKSQIAKITSLRDLWKISSFVKHRQNNRNKQLFDKRPVTDIKFLFLSCTFLGFCLITCVRCYDFVSITDFSQHQKKTYHVYKSPCQTRHNLSLSVLDQCAEMDTLCCCIDLHKEKTMKHT